jgi:hypothetical protein
MRFLRRFCTRPFAGTFTAGDRNSYSRGMNSSRGIFRGRLLASPLTTRLWTGRKFGHDSLEGDGFVHKEKIGQYDCGDQVQLTCALYIMRLPHVCGGRRAQPWKGLWLVVGL